MTVRIPLWRKGEVEAWATVDAADAELVMQRRWHYQRDRGGGYAVSTNPELDGKQSKTKMHRLILGLGPRTPEVDHVNRNGLDNRRTNLRVTSRLGNSQNLGAHKDSKTGIRGVRFDKRTGWWATNVFFDGEIVSSKRFRTVEEAASVAENIRAMLPTPEELA